MTKIKINLNTKSILQAIESLDEYQKNLTAKCEQFVSKLADLGIETAQANTGNYSGYITFTKELSPYENGCRGVMVACDAQKIYRSWRYQKGIKTVEVSPLLMAEFGSGWYAAVLDDVPGVGQGTFPGQTHAFDPYGWWWTDEGGQKHHSMGEKPTHPMHSAILAMIFNVEEVAREVFGGDYGQ